MPTYRNDNTYPMMADGLTWLPGETKATRWPHRSIYDANMVKTSDSPTSQDFEMLTVGDSAVGISADKLYKEGNPVQRATMINTAGTGSVVYRTDGIDPLTSSSGETGAELLAGNTLLVEHLGQLERLSMIRAYGSTSGEISVELEYAP